MPTETTVKQTGYEPPGKSFVIQTLCRAAIYAQSWDAVTSACEALANALRIARDMEAEAFRHDFSALAAHQREHPQTACGPDCVDGGIH